MSDADLIRYLHDELGDGERAHIDAQLAASPAAAERLRVLRRRTQRLSDLLGAADPTPAEVAASADAIRPLVEPESDVGNRYWWHRAPHWLKAAAVVALLLGGVMLVEPARAWVVEQVRTVAAAAGLIDPAPVPAPPSDGPAWRFSFPWDAATLEIDAGRARGSLVIRRGTDARVTVESADAGTTRVGFTPAGARITATDDPASYTFTVPPTVRELRVVTDGGVTVHPLDADFTEVRIPLR